ncbi:secreted RxLR effector protein 161-like [Capsicum annuum]|uniref:secreted RxLR effector protein 161-like n=1 Tax=Capsicum annuum TaxID=4072 RepID=UPI001FB0530D|nr:secreted RxLR effector protein 161-like [Capsicum annuum]
MDLLDDVGMIGYKGVPTPMTSTTTLTASVNNPPIDGTLYRRVIGKFHYLSFTRPDIAFTVSKLSQFMHNPRHCHRKVVKQLLCYLHHTCQYGIRIAKAPDSRLVVYSDLDWAGDLEDRTSTSGYVIFMGSTPISWSSKKQRSVSQSSTEAEYRGAAAAVAETNWITNLLHELRRRFSVTT